LRDAFAVLFFVSVGMLFDPGVILREPLALVLTLLIIIIGKSLAAFAIVRLFGHPTRTALTISASLAQIGEFSFILADLGIALGLLPDRARDLILGTAILSILANPILFAALERLQPWFERRATNKMATPAESGKAVEEELRPTSLTGHAVLVGYGRVGRLVGEDLEREGWPLLVIEDAAEAVERARTHGIETISGNAAEDPVLLAANVAQARILLIAIPNAFEAGQIIKQARAANPGLEIVARAHFDAEVDHLMQYGATLVIMGEREIARTMLEHVHALPQRDASAGGSPDRPSGPSSDTHEA
jgi:CPA2 family monovalent cation:H+ antiporter-2